jgi:hypothetical protein
MKIKCKVGLLFFKEFTIFVGISGTHLMSRSMGATRTLKINWPECEPKSNVYLTYFTFPPSKSLRCTANGREEVSQLFDVRVTFDFT